MKNLLFYLLLLSSCLTISCTQDEEIVSISSPDLKSEADERLRTKKELMVLAEQSLLMLEGKSTRGLSVKREIDSKGLIPVTSTFTRSQNSSGPLLYVANFKNEEGFALLSAVKGSEDILAVVEEGSFNPLLLHNEEYAPIAEYVQNAERHLANYMSSSRKPPLQPSECYENRILGYVGNFIRTAWGQGHPLGDYMPNKVAGCGNTALLMLMAHFQTPKSMDIYYTGDTVRLQLDWNRLAKYPSSRSRSKEEADILAKVARQVAYSNYSKFYFGENPQTGTEILDLWALAPRLGLQCVFTGDRVINTGKIAKGLKAGGLYCLAGYGRTEKTPGDHIWLLDGVYDIQRRYFDRREGREIHRETRTYCHFVWGWGMKFNGLYLPHILSTKYGYTYRPGRPEPEEYFEVDHLHNIFYITSKP